MVDRIEIHSVWIVNRYPQLVGYKLIAYSKKPDWSAHLPPCPVCPFMERFECATKDIYMYVCMYIFYVNTFFCKRILLRYKWQFSLPFSFLCVVFMECTCYMVLNNGSPLVLTTNVTIAYYTVEAVWVVWWHNEPPPFGPCLWKTTVVPSRPLIYPFWLLIRWEGG